MNKILITGGSGFIGTNLIEDLSAKGCPLLNYDINPPLDPEHSKYWSKADIMSAGQLEETFNRFRPEIVIHLAARTDCDEHTTVEEGYSTNTTGTQNILDIIRKTPSVQRVIMTSTQYVCRPGYTPKNDMDFMPHTVYGQSKVISEQLTRKAGLNCCWTIIRPTNIWGPWHLRYRREVWRIIRKGLYLHPGGKSVIRSYGFVGNIIWQIQQILSAEHDKVYAHVFYVGDKASDIYNWTNAFSVKFRGKPAKKAPRILFLLLGILGNMLKPFGITFPLTVSRYKSMTTDYISPLDLTFEQFGSPPFSLDEGVNKTAAWLDKCDSILSEYWQKNRLNTNCAE